MTAIENKELKGVTARLIYAIVFSTIVITGGGYGAYYGIKDAINQVSHKGEITQLQLDALKVQVSNIEIEQRELRGRIEEIEKGSK